MGNNFLVYELYEVESDAESPEALKEELQAEASESRVVVVGRNLREIAHPIHLAEAHSAFGHVGAFDEEEPPGEAAEEESESQDHEAEEDD